MNVVLARAAQRDLADIYEFIAGDSPTAAQRIIERLLAVIQQLADGQLKGPEERLTDGRRVRHWSVPSYGVYYRSSARRGRNRAGVPPGTPSS